MLEKSSTEIGIPVLNGAGIVNADVLKSHSAVVNSPAVKAGKINLSNRKALQVAVIGTGYVGLVTGAILADQGHNVICVDQDQSKLDVINRGESPIYEPGLEKIIQANLRNGRLTTTNLTASAVASSEIIIIAVGTPPTEDGTPDLTAVISVVNDIARSITKYTVIVNKSTVPVGTGDLVENTLLANGIDPDLFDVVSNPEFLREGSAVEDTVHPDRIIIGVNRGGAETKLIELYGTYGCPILVTNRNSAEMIKYATNSFLAVKISFINAISRICEKSGADVSEVAKGMGLDKRISPLFLQAGLGWGGSCFPKDVQGLGRTGETVGYQFDLLTAAYQINNEQAIHFLDRLKTRLGSLEGKKIALWGLSFKPNTDDVRDAKSIEMIDYLKEAGAIIVAHDPVAMNNMKRIHPDITYAETPLEAAKDAEAVILVTEWTEYIEVNLDDLAKTVKNRLIFDGRRAIRRADAEISGFEYQTIGCI